MIPYVENRLVFLNDYALKNNPQLNGLFCLPVIPTNPIHVNGCIIYENVYTEEGELILNWGYIHPPKSLGLSEKSFSTEAFQHLIEKARENYKQLDYRKHQKRTIDSPWQDEEYTSIDPVLLRMKPQQTAIKNLYDDTKIPVKLHGYFDDDVQNITDEGHLRFTLNRLRLL